MEIKFISDLKYSIEVDVHGSQTTVNKILSELFYQFRAQQYLGQQYGFSDRQASQYGSRLDWSRDEFYQSLYENPGPKPVWSAGKAITYLIVSYYIVSYRIMYSIISNRVCPPSEEFTDHFLVKGVSFSNKTYTNRTLREIFALSGPQ